MPLGVFKQRSSAVTSALTYDVQVRCGEKFCNSDRGKLQQIRENAADFQSCAQARRWFLAPSLAADKNQKKKKTCTASEIWPVEDVDEVTRDERKETKLQKQHEFG